jgi:hypothetical protein
MEAYVLSYQELAMASYHLEKLRLVPWYEVAVNDLIGPWTILVHGQEIEFYALTYIDPVSNLVEIT